MPSEKENCLRLCIRKCAAWTKVTCPSSISSIVVSFSAPHRTRSQPVLFHSGCNPGQTSLSHGPKVLAHLIKPCASPLATRVLPDPDTHLHLVLRISAFLLSGSGVETSRKSKRASDPKSGLEALEIAARATSDAWECGWSDKVDPLPPTRPASPQITMDHLHVPKTCWLGCNDLLHRLQLISYCNACAHQKNRRPTSQKQTLALDCTNCRKGCPHC